MTVRSRRPLHWSDVLLVMTWAVAYPLCLTFIMMMPWYFEAMGNVHAVLFPFHLYLFWLPGAIPIFRRLRSVVPASVAMQSLLAAVLFAPGYAIYVFTPAVAQIAYAGWIWVVSGEGPHARLAVVLGFVPLLLTWPLVYLGMRVRGRRRR